MSCNSDWVYFSHLIPGYVEKYGDRGMRDRNRLLLAGLQVHPEAGAALREILAENNLPLAMRVARNYQHLHGTTEDECWDDYQDACIELLNYMRSDEPLELTPGRFQVRAYRRMAAIVWAKHMMWLDNARVFQDEHVELVSTDFDVLPDLREPRADRAALLRLIRGALPERSAKIVELYYFGDGDMVEPMDAELIGWRFQLTRARIYQIINKSIRRLRRYCVLGHGWPADPQNFYQ